MDETMVKNHQQRWMRLGKWTHLIRLFGCLLSSSFLPALGLKGFANPDPWLSKTFRIGGISSNCQSNSPEVAQPSTGVTWSNARWIMFYKCMDPMDSSVNISSRYAVMCSRIDICQMLPWSMKKEKSEEEGISKAQAHRIYEFSMTF